MFFLVLIKDENKRPKQQTLFLRLKAIIVVGLFEFYYNPHLKSLRNDM